MLIRASPPLFRLFHDNNAYYSAVLDGEDVTATFRNALSRDMVNDYWVRGFLVMT